MYTLHVFRTRTAHPLKKSNSDARLTLRDRNVRLTSLRVNRSLNLAEGWLNTTPIPHPQSPLVADCAVCDEGFAPGIAYSCRECTGAITISAVGLAVAVCLVVLLFTVMLVYRLGSVAHDRTEEAMEISPSLWLSLIHI